MLILAGAKPTTLTSFLNGAPLLCVAAKEGFHDLVSLLLEFSAPVDQTGTDEVAPLSHAAANGNTEILRLLYAKGAKVCIAYGFENH